MALSYKTPGVYVREISVFPPSVAQVETAIPAFIGYTQTAAEFTANDLHLKAKKITSLLEFRQYYGGEPPLSITNVRLGPNGELAETAVQPRYNLFHSLQMFFSNGGGDCYIVSVGRYGDQVVLGDRSNPGTTPGLDAGLAVLETVDEPTIIAFPDAVLLTDAADQYTLQKNALAQCNDLQDRFAVFDLRESDAANPNFNWKDGRDAFRDNIGTQFLKYGAAYAPHLRTSLPKVIQYRDFRNNPAAPSRFNRGGVAVDLKALPGASEVGTEIDTLELAAADLTVIENENSGTDATLANAAPEDTIRNRAAMAAYGVDTDAASSAAGIIAVLHDRTMAGLNTITAFRQYVDFLYELFVFADGWIYDAASTHRTSAEYKALVTGASQALDDALNDAMEALVAFDKGADSELAADMNRFALDGSGPDVRNRIVANGNYAGVDFTSAASGPAANTAPFTGANDIERRRNALPALRMIADQMLSVLDSLRNAAATGYKMAEDNLAGRLPAYRNLVRELQSALSTLPPSGAIAGVYAQVDATRGVWKAPANVSLNNVRDLTVQFTNAETDGLNVNEFGKSINAIKFFTGRGTLVWGARTLAGNDNEWRYVPVRRFFNMVEESVKKSTMWAVFEPNDSGTWLKVKGMIENFLTLQWRAGALQGAKPDEAFFVKIGLGQTMNAVDILEGRMIVEIGMAVVRPAEFILLTFMHKMVETG